MTKNEPMTVKNKRVPAAVQMFLLDKAKKRPDRFSLLHPKVVSSTGGLKDSIAQATKDTLISIADRLRVKVDEIETY